MENPPPLNMFEAEGAQALPTERRDSDTDSAEEERKASKTRRSHAMTSEARLESEEWEEKRDRILRKLEHMAQIDSVAREALEHWKKFN